MKKDELSVKLEKFNLADYQILQVEESEDKKTQAVLLKSRESNCECDCKKRKIKIINVKLILVSKNDYQLVHEEIFKKNAEINFSIKKLNQCFLSFKYKAKELLYSINDQKFFVPRKN